MAHLSRLIPSVRGLLVFEAAARTGSFTAAAAEFNVSQPSISRSVAELEAAVGARLFERRARGLELTADGRDLFGVVGEAVGRIADAVQTIQQRQRAAKPVVTLSMSSSFVVHWLLPRLGEFHEAFPQIDIRFDLIPGVLRGIPDNVDLATRIIEDDDPRYHSWFFAPEIIFPVCSPAYLRARGKLDHSGDGAGHVFLWLTEHATHEWARGWGNVANRSTSKGVWHEFTDYSVILQAALNGEGIALGWLSVVSSRLLRGALVPASDLIIRSGRHHSLIAPRSRPLNPVVADVALWLRARIAQELDALDEIYQLRRANP
ncbi:DNA-binding transcriptional LysR family regulator [Hyphomicrobiales bacterium]|nr:DNA-binding transcriptional LysR family regulator [Hyphomicrobiales bacterium]CAH1701344.1 DNA-binding transcriptional LysR family regulator [Hyphomicrobiales bacterium]CAI0345302.1 LysR family transcriptional regulator, glycine cleavage system transcriptional activator [Hyphomicrobiales bacterium]